MYNSVIELKIVKEQRIEIKKKANKKKKNYY